MRTAHNLWKVSNGWLLIPEGTDRVLTVDDASEAAVFKTLEEFAKWNPPRKRNRKTKPKPKPASTEAQHTKD